MYRPGRGASVASRKTVCVFSALDENHDLRHVGLVV